MYKKQMKNNKTTKRVDLPVDEFIAQFPIIAQLDFLIDSFDGYEEENEINQLIKLYDKEK